MRVAWWRRLLLSLGAQIIGWAAGMAFYWTCLMLVQGSATDLEAALFWTAVFGFVGWLLVLVPLVLLVRPERALFSFPVFPLVGAAVAVVTFIGLVGWWTGGWREPLWLGHAASFGLGTGGSYSLLSRR